MLSHMGLRRASDFVESFLDAPSAYDTENTMHKFFLSKERATYQFMF